MSDQDGAEMSAAVPAAPEAPSEASEVAPAAVSESVETAPKPKRMGRPVGVKDSKPRQRKRVEVRVEPLVAPEPAVKKPEPDPEPPVEIEEAPEPPPSPRTLLRETSRHLMTLRGMVHDARRSELGTKYAQKLMSWPPVPHFV